MPFEFTCVTHAVSVYCRYLAAWGILPGGATAERKLYSPPADGMQSRFCVAPTLACSKVAHVQSHQAQGGKRGWFVRRQASSLPTSIHPVAGVSSFAYQGTNSHLVAGGICQALATVTPETIWHRRRFWYQVSTHIGAAGPVMPVLYVTRLRHVPGLACSQPHVKGR